MLVTSTTETTIEIKANKNEEQIEQILSEVSGRWLCAAILHSINHVWFSVHENTALDAKYPREYRTNEGINSSIFANISPLVEKRWVLRQSIEMIVYRSNNDIIFTALPESVETMRHENMSLCQKVSSWTPPFGEWKYLWVKAARQVYSQMKELEVDLPKPDDGTIVARIKRLQFYSVREEFLNVWKDHEQFLLVYEERVKKALLRQARIGECHRKCLTTVTNVL